MDGLLRCLSPAERENFLSQVSLTDYPQHATIYTEGGRPDSLFCLISGKVKIFKQGAGGRNQTIRLIKPAEFFGYRPFLTHQHIIAGAATIDPSLVARLPLEAFASLLHTNNNAANFFIHELAEALGKADQLAVNLTQKRICGRMAEALIFLMESYGLEQDGCTLSIYMSREDIANLSNMTTSNAIRTLSAFSSDKLIAVDGRKIKIINERELRRISMLG